MNYQRVKRQSALKKFIKEKLAEKQYALRSLKGAEKVRAEKLIINKAKEEFEMGYKNSNQKGKEDESTDEGSETNPEKGSETNPEAGGDGPGEGDEGGESGGDGAPGAGEGSGDDGQGSDENGKSDDDQSLAELVSDMYEQGAKTKDEMYEALYCHDFQSAPYDEVESFFENLGGSDEDPEKPGAEEGQDPEAGAGEGDDSEKKGSEKPFEEMDEEELKAYAAEKGIDLGNASSKNGFIKKIRKHLES